MQKIRVPSQSVSKIDTIGLVKLGLFTALVTLATMVIHIPTPGTQGYINIGDTIIFTGAALFGWRFGLLTGGFGSFLADMFLGYAHWAPWTLVIKGIEGLIAGILVKRLSKRKHPGGLFAALGVSGAWMVLGYFLASWVIYQNAAVAAAEVPGNLAQAVASIALSVPLIGILRTKLQ